MGFYCDLSSSWISVFVSATAVTALSRQICDDRFHSVCLSVFVRAHEWRMCRAARAAGKAPAPWVSYQRWNKITLPSPHPQRTCSRYRRSVIDIQATSTDVPLWIQKGSLYWLMCGLAFALCTLTLQMYYLQNEAGRGGGTVAGKGQHSWISRTGGRRKAKKRCCFAGHPYYSRARNTP